MTEKFNERSAMKLKDETGIYTWTASRCLDIEALLELGSIGAGHAATSLSEILQQPIWIDVPKIHTLPPHLIPKFYERHDKPTTAIYMQLSGESECDILLLFEKEEAIFSHIHSQVPKPNHSYVFSEVHI